MMHLMKLNIQIIKKMIKINKQRYFDVFSKYSKGCLGVSWGNKTDRPYFYFPFSFIKNRFNSVTFKLYVSHLIYAYILYMLAVVSKTEK